MQQRRRWYELSGKEIWIGLVPPGFATCLVVMFYGSETYAAVLAHGLVNILTLPGFIILEMARLIFRFGSLHGDDWDALSIPLSAVFMVAMMRILPKQKRPTE